MFTSKWVGQNESALKFTQLPMLPKLRRRDTTWIDWIINFGRWWGQANRKNSPKTLKSWAKHSKEWLTGINRLRHIYDFTIPIQRITLECVHASLSVLPIAVFVHVCVRMSWKTRSFDIANHCRMILTPTDGNCEDVGTRCYISQVSGCFHGMRNSLAFTSFSELMNCIGQCGRNSRRLIEAF